jgi:hypothetical protein
MPGIGQSQRRPAVGASRHRAVESRNDDVAWSWWVFDVDLAI